jgi:hypothetical protein
LTGTFSSSEIIKLTSYSDYEPLSFRTGREFSTTNTTGTIVPSSSRLQEIYSSLVVLVHHMSFHSPPAYHHLCDVNMCIIDIYGCIVVIYLGLLSQDDRLPPNFILHIFQTTIQLVGSFGRQGSRRFSFPFPNLSRCTATDFFE